MPTPPRSRSRRAPTCSSPAPRPSRAGRMPMPAISGGCAAPDMGEGRPLTSAPADPLPDAADDTLPLDDTRSEEHTSELQSLMRISYAVFCLTKKKYKTNQQRRPQLYTSHTI